MTVFTTKKNGCIRDEGKAAGDSNLKFYAAYFELRGKIFFRFVNSALAAILSIQIGLVQVLTMG